MWLLKVTTLVVSFTVTCGCRWGSVDWRPWSTCTHSCGGGTQRRFGELCFWQFKRNQSRTCNEFCFNGGVFVGGRCQCNAWRSGRCCQTCRNIYIPHCKGGQVCGGSPDNIKCTECMMPYTSAGWGKGCRRLICTERNGGCDHTCLTERGITKCTCRSGFTLSQNSYSCIDIDECRAGTANCDHTCTNTVGSFKCSCRSGYSLDSDSHSCSDVDECLTGVARCDQTCINTNGSFHCSCNVGFTLSADRTSCIDVNECENNNGGCKHTCINEPGSFHCKCNSGYRMEKDGFSCTDIDECSESISKCSQLCANEQGNYTCRCQQGYSLQNDGFSCKDIDDCHGVICNHGGTCLDNVGSFTCSCSKGFTGKHCEHDIDECLGFLHGGCEDSCINSVGSFHCECSGNKTLNSDGFSCTGGEKSASVFSRHGLVRNLLPRGCSTILLSRCTEGKTVDVFMSSTSPWYQLRTNSSLIFTFGIVFVEVNQLSLPVSITGLEIVKQNDGFAVVTGTLALDENESVKYGEERTVDCVTFTTTPRDIHDFLMSASFMKSFYNMLNKVLPDWLSFSQQGSAILGVNDLHTELLSGKDIQNGECRGAPVYDNRLYTVLKFGSSFALSLYGDQVTLPSALTNQQFCLIIDICQDYGGSIFLIIPEESRDILNKFKLFRNLKEKYGVGFRPVGLGLSLFKHINVHFSATSLQLWNGDAYFTYRVMPEASLWVGGGVLMTYNSDIFSVNLEADSNVYASIPSPQDILKSMFLEEWNVLLKLRLRSSVGIHFRLFGQNHTLQLKSVLTSEINAYASLGGLAERAWCGEYANPPGIFLSVLVDINPFKEVPILKHGLFDFNSRVFAYFSTDPTVNMTISGKFDVMDSLLNVKQMVGSFINITVANVFRYSSLLVSQSVKLLNILKNTASEFLKSLETFISELRHGQSNSIQHLINAISDIWSNGWKKLQTDTERFVDSIENVTVIAKYNFSSLLTQEVDILKTNLEDVRDKLMRQVLDIFTAFQGFGIRYKGNLKIFHLNIVGLEIEFVYSTDQLGACSRFSKVFSQLKGERAARILGVVSSGLFRIAPFIHMNVGAGVGLVLSIDTPGRIIAQLHAEANVLGISGSVDVFLTEQGHYFFLEGKVWNTFKAELQVSFESHAQSGVIDTFGVKGTFLANAGDGNSFHDSYLDGLRKLISKLADEANKRLTQVQSSFTSAQKALTNAQNWLEDKKKVVRNANSEFDRAVQSLEHAKAKLEDAKGPFRNALSKLNKVQRKVDNLCRIRSCSRVCVPGLKCRICWKKVWFVRIPYPCCHLTSCMFSFPNPICIAFNLGCRAIRAVAYLALEAAKVFVRVPMLALDAAKALVSGVQFVVDKSRVVLDIAVGALDLAKLGLEGTKHVLEGAKFALEAVKKVVGWGLKALDYLIQYGLQSIIDVKNCGFELTASVYDTIVFHVTCEINVFRQGFRTVKLGINFGNPIQSIWQAAKGTVDAFVDVSDQAERNRREVKSKALTGLHKVIRKAREADIDNGDFDIFLNDTIDTVFRTNGFKENASAGDYENRVEIFKEKCSVFQNVFNFYSEALQVLIEMSNETANTLYNASSLEDELTGFNLDDIASNFSTETLGVNTDAAFEDFNISKDDINAVMENAKGNLSNDPLLSGINDLSKNARLLLQNQTHEANNMKVLEQWMIVMENITTEYFTEDKCISFLDCAHFAVFKIYDLFDAENVTYMTESMEAISLIEDLFLDLTGNLSHTVLEINDLAHRISETLSTLNDFNVFCSKPPHMLSPMASQTIRKGGNLHIICNVTGNPLPNIWWFRNDVYLPDQRNIELVILNVSETDSQKYHCVAGNLVANLSSKYAEVFVTEDEPEPNIYSQEATTASDTDIKSTATHDVFKEKKVETDQKSTTSELTIILGVTSSGLVLIIAIGVASAWRIHVRKKARKSEGPGSIASLNMVRPEVQKPIFSTGKNAWVERK